MRLVNDLESTIVQDKTDSDYSYYGEAEPGSALDAPVWRIYRIAESGQELLKSWANGSTAYKFKWTDRLNYEYK